MSTNSFAVKEIEVPVPWGHVAGKIWGEDSGMPVILLHGLKDNCGSFDRLIPLLTQKGFRYIALDLPGHGKSSILSLGLPIDLMNFIYCLDLVVNFLKLNEFYLVGHSLGAQLCFLYTIIFPEKVQRIVLIDGILYKNYSAEESFQEIRKRFDQTRHIIKNPNYNNKQKYSYEEILSVLLRKRQTKITSDNAKILLERNLISSPEGYQLSTDPRFKASISPIFNMEQVLSVFLNIKCPIFFILTKSTFNRSFHDPKYLNYLGSLPNFKTIIVEGDHDVHLEHPEKIAASISLFLQEMKCQL